MKKSLLLITILCGFLFCHAQEGSIINWSESFTQLEPYQIHNSTPFEANQLNFTQSELIYAGDLNGDGFDDAYFFAGHVADERTDDKYDRTYKSFVVFGGNDLSKLSTKLVFSKIYPVGDLNNDNYDDLIGANPDGSFQYLYGAADGNLTTSGVTQTLDTWGLTNFPSNIRGFCDFNADNFQDFILNLGFEDFVIVYGADVESKMEDHQYNIEFGRGPQYGWKKINVGRLGTNHTLIVNMYAAEGDFTNEDINDDQHIVFDIYDLSTGIVVKNEEVVVKTKCWRHQTIYGGTFNNIGAMELTGDGAEEWVFAYNFDRLSYLKVNNGNVEFGGEMASFDPSDYPSFENIGDFNGDGREDFIKVGEGIGLTDVNQNVIFGNQIDFETSNVGDFDGDGTSNFCGLIENNAQKNYWLFSFYPEATSTSAPIGAEIVFQADFAGGEYVKTTQSIGDFDGDGNDDYVFYSDDGFELFTKDKSFTEAPGRTDGDRLRKIVSADYNGDGYNDIICLIREENGADPYIKFYWGSSTPDLTSNFTFSPTVWGIDLESFFEMSLDEIGDVNGDGQDDLTVSHIGANETFYIIPGGDDPTKVSVLSCSVSPGYGNTVSGRAMVAGDLNQDGIDDFILGTVGLDAATYGNNQSGIYVYFGDGESTTAESYSSPDLILHESLINGDYNNYGFHLTIGDFNGDGKNDVATIPSRIDWDSTAPANGEEHEMLLIYYGGNAMDNMADIKQKLPYRLWGEEVDGYVTKFGKELTCIPDINGDNCDELFIGNNYSSTSSIAGNRQKYGVILYGGNDLENGNLKGKYLLGFSSIGTASTSYYFSDFHSAVGDFNGDGNIELLARCYDGNYNGTSVYEYRFKEVPTNTINIGNDSEANVYPNPCSTHFFVQNSEPCKVEVYSIKGDLVLVKNIEARNHEVDMANQKGLYLLKIISASGIEIQKIRVR